MSYNQVSAVKPQVGWCLLDETAYSFTEAGVPFFSIPYLPHGLGQAMRQTDVSSLEITHQLVAMVARRIKSLSDLYCIHRQGEDVVAAGAAIIEIADEH